MSLEPLPSISWRSRVLPWDKGKEYLLETRLNPLLGKYGCKSYAELLRRSKNRLQKGD